MIKIDSRSSKPLYEQIVDNIKENVIKGYLKSGDEMPSVRKMAISLSVTPNTVSKAYQELERQKIIETIRGKGTYVADTSNIKVDDEKTEQIQKELKKQIIELKCMGLTKQEIIDIFTELCNSL